MNKKVKVMVMVAIMVVGTAAFAGHHEKRHRRNEGLELARGIVNLVTGVVRPAPVGICKPVPVPIHRRPAPPPKHKPHKINRKPVKHHR